MAKVVPVDEKRRQFELMKKEHAWIYDMITKPYRCKACGFPVSRDWESCPHCGEKQAVDITKAK